MPAALPARLSQLLRLSVQSLQECEQDERCRIMPSGWVKNYEDWGYRQVSAAGSVLYRVLGVEHGTPADLYRNGQIDRAQHRLLLALDALVRGRVRQAMAFVQLFCLSVDDWVQVTPYHVSREQFFQDLLQIAHALEIRGY